MALPSSPAENLATGQLRPGTTWGDYNNILYVVQQAIGKLQTATLVQIVACTNAGELAPVGRVDVLPLVNQIDGNGIATPHVTVYNLPYLRVQGGGNAVICDPQPGDIGIAVFASRDISKVKATKAQANPGSLRQYNFGDGLYLGGVLNGTPNQYVQFNAAGIKIHSPTAVVLEAPTVQIDASVSCTINTPTFTVNGATFLNGPLAQGTGAAGGAATMRGPLTVINDVTAVGTSVHTHVHGGVQTGSGNTGAPV